MPYEDDDFVLTPEQYEATSVTRSCAKIYLGNTCRRDWLGAPLITCITTCDRDYCNCDKRSPPPEMFADGKPLALAPNTSTYPPEDMSVCRKLAAKRKHMMLEKMKESANQAKTEGRKRQGFSRNSSHQNGVSQIGWRICLTLTLLTMWTYSALQIQV